MHKRKIYFCSLLQKAKKVDLKAPKIRRILSLYIEGQKFTAIAAKKLNKGNLKYKIAGIRTPAKKRRFCKHRKCTYTF